MVEETAEGLARALVDEAHILTLGGLILLVALVGHDEYVSLFIVNGIIIDSRAAAIEAVMIFLCRP